MSKNRRILKKALTKALRHGASRVIVYLRVCFMFFPKILIVRSMKEESDYQITDNPLCLGASVR